VAALPEHVAAALAGAERPAIIVGMGALTVPGLYEAAAGLAKAANVVRDGWNGWNLLHTAAARPGALALGLAVDGGLPALLADDGIKALFLLGADECDVPAGRFTVYIGTHGDRGVRHADVILPAAAYTEKPGTYVNMEGRVQRSLKATQPPGDAREDWTILRALSSVLGVKLGYDDLSALRARIAAEWPALGAAGLLPRGGSLPDAAPVAGLSGAVPLAVTDHWRTNPIARASATMAECAAVAAPAAMEAAE
jgi:NADH-quinone oxidoreductase subunit G